MGAYGAFIRSVEQARIGAFRKFWSHAMGQFNEASTTITTISLGGSEILLLTGVPLARLTAIFNRMRCSDLACRTILILSLAFL